MPLAKIKDIEIDGSKKNKVTLKTFFEGRQFRLTVGNEQEAKLLSKMIRSYTYFDKTVESLSNSFAYA